MGVFKPDDTNCGECIFEHNPCWFSLIEKYRKKNIEMEIKDGHYILKQFTCPYQRSKEWYDSFRDSFDISNPPSFQDTKKKVQEENLIPYVPILLFPKRNMIGATLRKLTRFDVAPREYHIILEKDRQNELPEIKELCQKIGLPWRISFEIEPNSWHSIFKSYNRTEFLMLLTGYPYVKNNWGSELTTLIQDELLTFPYAQNKQETITLIPPHVYNSYYFEYGPKFLETLKEQRHAQKYLL